MMNPCAEMMESPSGDPLEEAVRVILRTVPGVTTSAHRPCLQAMPREADGSCRIEVAASGWSPTLHRLPILVTGVIEASVASLADEIASVRAFMEPMTTCQKARAARAGPLDVFAPLTPTKPGPVGHLHVDRSLALVARDSLAARVDEAVGVLHSGFSAHPGHGMHAFGNAFAGDLTRGGETISFIGFRMHVGTARPGGVPVFFDGVQITLHAEIPETALQALVGRRVGDLAKLDGAVDDRVIRQIRQGASRIGMPEIVVTLDPDPVSVREAMTWW